MFIVSFVVVTVKARLIDFDRHLEEAAMDLGANELTTFRKMTLPLLAPAILSAALLGFALSIDDFVITYFVAGSTTTFPIFVWGAARVSVPPQVNVIASAIFLVAVLVMIGNVLWGLRGRRAREPMPAAVPLPEPIPDDRRPHDRAVDRRPAAACEGAARFREHGLASPPLAAGCGDDYRLTQAARLVRSSPVGSGQRSWPGTTTR